MTVKELMAKLKDYPQEMRIIIPDGGDGGGYNSVEDIKSIKVSSFFDGRGSYYGEFTDYTDSNVDSICQTKEGKIQKVFNNHFDALLIS